jgi:hypothetical protein
MYPPEAMEFISYHSGTKFDPSIVEVFKRVIALYPVGVCVEMNSKVRCLVVKNYAGKPHRPKLRLLGTMSKTPLYIDLLKDSKFVAAHISHIVEDC